MPRRKSSKSSTHFVTVELQNMLIGGLLTTIGALLVLSTKESSVVGIYLSQVGKFAFGEYYRWIGSSILIALGCMIVIKRVSWSSARAVGIVLYYVSLTSLLGWYVKKSVGFFDIYAPLEALLGASSAFLALLFGLLTSLWMTLRISYRAILSHVRERVPSTLSNVKNTLVSAEIDDSRDDFSRRSKNDDGYKRKAEQLEKKLADIERRKGQEEKEQKQSPSPLSGKEILANTFSRLTKKVPIETPDGKVVESKLKNSIDFGAWDFPSIKLLNEVEHKNLVSSEEIEEKSILIQKTLLQFGIDVDMEDECVGPTVIQYRLRPAEGIRLTKITGLKDNLTLALKAKSIRIQAPIPGLGLVGIEVPNEKRDVVGVREVLSDTSFTHHKSRLALAVGKDINGDYIVGDLAKMPHLLIAGQTGSGKSVGMNGFILSLLYKNTPSDLRMIMVDPKQVELGVYDGIPHLLTPVITSPDKALNALKWSVAEMERRLTVFKGVGARNLDEYNAKVSSKDRMPIIVIIIDELADLMMSGNKKEVENAIGRIAQKARAAGLHLILATQRPSVDVITGTIKANVPSRVAFTVASRVDSGTILDSIGAEDLLGRGDMLYFPTGAMAATRVQGVLVETEEVERIVNHIKRTIDPEMLSDIYDASIVEGDRGNFEGSVGGGDYTDEDSKIIEEAIELVRSSGKCSTSMLQRHLKLGYGRAARVVDILESMGIVGPADGSKPREVIG